MHLDISTTLNILLVLLLLIVMIKQWVVRKSVRDAFKRVEDYYAALLRQHQSTEQQLKDSFFMQANNMQHTLMEKLNQTYIQQSQQAGELKEQLQHALSNHRARFDERQLETLKILQDTLIKGTQDNRQQLKESLLDYSKEFGTRIEALTLTTETKLKEINHQVEKRLTDGFVKTNETFNDVIKRLALIDAAQKKIGELSSSVLNLQEILNDKRSRGTFGEVQLSALIYNMIPQQHFSFQHLLSNHKRPDCMLFLPEPTGNIAIDAKFPLENYRLLIDSTVPEATRQQAERQFKIDIRKHIQDIAEKYIIPGETSDGAVMFIPAEAVFAEIHAHYSDLVEIAQKSKVWMVSPTTMMAILTTARAVLKDASTRNQVVEIQKHLSMLAGDFDRFQLRMDNLAKRIAQAHSDVEQVHISSRKISQRFNQIEKAELAEVSLEPMLVESDATQEEDISVVRV